MRHTWIAIALLLLTPSTALATKAMGEISNDFYWLLTDKDQWHCRAVGEPEIQRHQLCINAGAVKPQEGEFHQ